MSKVVGYYYFAPVGTPEPTGHEPWSPEWTRVATHKEPIIETVGNYLYIQTHINNELLLPREVFYKVIWRAGRPEQVVFPKVKRHESDGRLLVADLMYVTDWINDMTETSIETGDLVTYRDNHEPVRVLGKYTDAKGRLWCVLDRAMFGCWHLTLQESKLTIHIEPFIVGETYRYRDVANAHRELTVVHVQDDIAFATWTNPTGELRGTCIYAEDRKQYVKV
jgi:hypothetical protein